MHGTLCALCGATFSPSGRPGRPRRLCTTCAPSDMPKARYQAVWKASNPESVARSNAQRRARRAATHEPRRYERVCEYRHCRQPFVATRSTQRFHHPLCKERAAYDRGTRS